MVVACGMVCARATGVDASTLRVLFQHIPRELMVLSD